MAKTCFRFPKCKLYMPTLSHGKEGDDPDNSLNELKNYDSKPNYLRKIPRYSFSNGCKIPCAFCNDFRETAERTLKNALKDTTGKFVDVHLSKYEGVALCKFFGRLINAVAEPAKSSASVEGTEADVELIPSCECANCEALRRVLRRLEEEIRERKKKEDEANRKKPEQKMTWTSSEMEDLLQQEEDKEDMKYKRLRAKLRWHWMTFEICRRIHIVQSTFCSLVMLLTVSVDWAFVQGHDYDIRVAPLMLLLLFSSSMNIYVMLRLKVFSFNSYFPILVLWALMALSPGHCDDPLGNPLACYNLIHHISELYLGLVTCECLIVFIFTLKLLHMVDAYLEPSSMKLLKSALFNCGRLTVAVAKVVCDNASRKAQPAAGIKEKAIEMSATPI